MAKIYDNAKSYNVIKDTVEAQMRSILDNFGQLQNAYQVNKVVEQGIDNDKLPMVDWDNNTRNKILSFELIWSFWMELGMLVQTMNIICLRFQNLYNSQVVPISRFDLSPLRPLSHVIWAYLQDEQFRLSIKRRVLEYDHEYGLQLSGKAISPFKGIDSNKLFLEAFHNVLTSASQYRYEDNDKMRTADAFPLFNSINDLHLILSKGNNNAYSDLTWVARKEMMIQQRILGTQEMQQFLGGKQMVKFPGANSEWMGIVETMWQLQGWGNVNMTSFFELAECGERLLLSIRYGNWSELTSDDAESWEESFRNDIQKYIYAYRSVTGVDLSYQAMQSTSKELRIMQPALLIKRKAVAAGLGTPE